MNDTQRWLARVASGMCARCLHAPATAGVYCARCRDIRKAQGQARRAAAKTQQQTVAGQAEAVSSTPEIVVYEGTEFLRMFPMGRSA